MTAFPAPHRFVRERPAFLALVAAASLLLSLWAMSLDPVINSDGIGDVRAAEYFSAAEWRAAIDEAGRPVYALAAALLSLATGMSAVHSLYALNAGFFALLAVGFTALVAVLGGGRRAQLLAALLVLLFPALNGFRAHVAGDAGYWAFYIWSLGYFMHYAAQREPRSLAYWALAAVAALLWAVEALVFLLLVPLWLLAHNKRPGRILKALALTAGGAVLLVYALWGQAWQAGVPVEQLLWHPVDQLAEARRGLGRELGFKLEALSTHFLDRYSRDFDDAALLATLLVMGAAGLLKALGVVYTLLAGGALVASRRVLAAGQRYWWGVFVVVSSLLLLVPALTRFAVPERDAMTAALTLLAVAPLALARLWRQDGDTESEPVRQRRVSAPTPVARYRRWVLPLALALVIGSGAHGLDLRSGRMHLREAGLWLRANAAPDDVLYSNSPVVLYYAGMRGHRPRADHSWPRVMTAVRRGQWRDYDYLALVIDAENAHREGILMRNIDIEPVRIFTGEAGDRVLIFDSRR